MTLKPLKHCSILLYEVERSEFRIFARHLLSKNTSIQALEWIPHAQRSFYEEKARTEGFADFTITERKEQGIMEPADLRKEYFPVYYIEPYRGNEKALGFDLASNPVRFQALNKSRDTGQLSDTARIRLVQEKGADYGFLIFNPLFHNTSPSEPSLSRFKLKGFVLGVFRMSDMIENALRYFDLKDIHFAIYDNSAQPQDSFLYSHGNESLVNTSDQSASGHNSSSALLYKEIFSVADRKWLLVFTPALEFIRSRQSIVPLLSSLVLLLCTAMLTIFFLLTASRIAESNRYARELEHRKEELEEEARKRAKLEEEREQLIIDLRNAFADVRTLSGMLPNMCFMQEDTKR